MHKCEHYPDMVMRNFDAAGLVASFNGDNFTEEELHHLQQIAALQRESCMQRSGFGDLCQSDLD